MIGIDARERGVDDEGLSGSFEVFAPGDGIKDDGRIVDTSDGEGESSGAGHSGPSTTGTCIAYSTDGVHFSKPLQDVVPETNFVRQTAFDGNTVWLDRGEQNASRRYKMADVDAAQSYAHYTLLASPDGVRS